MGRDGKVSYCFLYYFREDRDWVCGMIVKDNMLGDRRDKGGEVNKWVRMESYEVLVRYCEDMGGCRYVVIIKYFGEKEVLKCDFVCDWYKDWEGLKRRWREGLVSEEWVCM